MDSMKIAISLVVLSQIFCQYGVEAKKISSQEDLELEKKLHILNKPPIKTFHTESGDIFDCIDIYKQPAFDHPLLKDHKIQMRPTSWNEEFVEKTQSHVQSSIAILRGVECPEGTVPMRRTQKEDLIRAKLFPKSYATEFYTERVNDPGFQLAFLTPIDRTKTYYGSHAFIDSAILEIKDGQHTTGQMWIENGDSLQTGWMVAPNIFGDQLTRFFAFWQQSKTIGCYNILCSGFVQVDKKYTVGMELISPTKYGSIYHNYFPVTISQDRTTGDWWLTYNTTHVGYWPSRLVPRMAKGANVVAWGGLTFGANGDSPPMGNGHFPPTKFTQDGCFIGGLRMIDASNNIVYPDEHNMGSYISNKTCYDVKYYGVQDELEQVCAFGGPGGTCGI